MAAGISFIRKISSSNTVAAPSARNAFPSKTNFFINLILMKTAKPMLGTITIFLIAVSIWMKITSFEGHGTSVSRTGRVGNYTMDSTGMLLIAAIFAGGYIALDTLDRKKR